MSEKQIPITIERQSGIVPATIVGKSFNISADRLRSHGWLDVTIGGDARVSKIEQIVLDGTFIMRNPTVLGDYLGSLNMEADDSAVDPKLPPGVEQRFANILQLGRAGLTAESTFVLVSLHDWGTAVRSTTKAEKLLKAPPVLSVYSSTAFQKKMISEILAAFANQTAIK